jgi:hypothetical protein
LAARHLNFLRPTPFIINTEARLNILRRINLFIEIYIRVLKGLKSVRLLAPFLILAVVKGLVLIALILFYLPPVYRLLVPILDYFYSDYTLHYPRYYLLLPQIYNYASSFLVELIFGIVLTGAAVFMIGTDLKKERGGFGESLRSAFKSLIPLIFVWIIRTFVLIIVLSLCSRLIFRLVHGLPYSDFAGYILLQIVGLVITGFFIYAIPAIMLHRLGIGSALATGIGFFLKHPFFSFFILLIPWLLQLPLRYLAFSKIHLILAFFNHVLLNYLLAIDIIVGVVTGYLMYAGITHFYLYVTEK